MAVHDMRCVHDLHASSSWPIPLLHIQTAAKYVTLRVPGMGSKATGQQGSIEEGEQKYFWLVWCRCFPIC